MKMSSTLKEEEIYSNLFAPLMLLLLLLIYPVSRDYPHCYYGYYYYS